MIMFHRLTFIIRTRQAFWEYVFVDADEEVPTTQRQRRPTGDGRKLFINSVTKAMKDQFLVVKCRAGCRAYQTRCPSVIKYLALLAQEDHRQIVKYRQLTTDDRQPKTDDR